jgi:hypothetical protein
MSQYMSAYMAIIKWTGSKMPDLLPFHALGDTGCSNMFVW